MQFFGAVKNIHHEQVIQQKIFDKIILIIPLLICHQEALDLQNEHLTDRIHILRVPAYDNDILQLGIIVYFEKLTFMDHLAVRRRLDKTLSIRLKTGKIFRSGCQNISFRVHHTQIHLSNPIHTVYGILQNLIRDHGFSSLRKSTLVAL